MGSLLPNNSGQFERALEASYAKRWSILADAVAAIRTAKLISPPSSLLPYLVHEYGLGEITPYIPNTYTLIVSREGVNWQRLRGTPAAVEKGLGWIGYSGTLEDAWHGRAYWNSTQLRFPALPAADDPDLERIEGIASLSLPKRSHLRRGVHLYDAGAVELDRSRLDDCLPERESGVAVTQRGTIWSFGRVTEVDHLLEEAEGTALGNWLPVPEDAGIKWVTMQYQWTSAVFKWADNPATQRRALMAAWFAGRTLYAVLRDSADQIIGYRRCRAVRPVSQMAGGSYQVASISYEPKTGGTRVYIEAMTDFGDASGVEARSVALVAGSAPVAGVPAGRLWLQPGELSGGVEFANHAVSLPLRTTVRDQLKFILRF